MKVERKTSSIYLQKEFWIFVKGGKENLCGNGLLERRKEDVKKRMVKSRERFYSQIMLRKKKKKKKKKKKRKK